MYRMDQYVKMADSIAASRTAVEEELNPTASDPFYFCSWINNQLSGRCDLNQTRHDINNGLCHKTELNLRKTMATCSEQLYVNSC